MWNAGLQGAYRLLGQTAPARPAAPPAAAPVGASVPAMAADQWVGSSLAAPSMDQLNAALPVLNLPTLDTPALPSLAPLPDLNALPDLAPVTATPPVALPSLAAPTQLPAPLPAPAPAPQLAPAPAPAPKPQQQAAKTEGKGPLLMKGHAGEPVKKLQERLKQLGFDPGPADGIFGPKTLAAVKAFQRAKGLETDGVVGPKTWGQLGIVVTGTPHQANAASAPSYPTDAKGVAQTPDGPMVSRQGKLISATIAGNFDRMVEAAKKDGVDLRINNAYRSYQEQVVLWNRYGHNRARVAPPGHSNHQKGEAIDFVNTRGAYAWLKANAAKFGLHNYPPEPWHYSLTGG